MLKENLKKYIRFKKQNTLDPYLCFSACIKMLSSPARVPFIAYTSKYTQDSYTYPNFYDCICMCIRTRECVKRLSFLHFYRFSCYRGSTLNIKLDLYLKQKIILEPTIIKVKSIPSISTSTSTLLPLVNSIGL